MTKNSKEPRSTVSGAGRIYRQGKKHRPLFSEELDEVLREDVPQARPASRPPRSVAAVSTPAVRRNSQKSGFFRTVKIVLKVLFDEAAAFFKKQFAGKNARIAATAAVVCIVGLAAIISVAAVSTRKDDSGADGAALNSPGRIGRLRLFCRQQRQRRRHRRFRRHGLRRKFAYAQRRHR